MSTPSVTNTCVCPTSSTIQLIALINNNLVNLFSLMSAGLWTGTFVNLGACLCSEPQILAAMNNNVVSFFGWVTINGLGGGAQAGKVALSNGDTTKVVTFTTAFSAAPVVTCWLVPPDNTQPIISCDPIAISTTGFTALFANTIPAAGYTLMWMATKSS